MEKPVKKVGVGVAVTLAASLIACIRETVCRESATFAQHMGSTFFSRRPSVWIHNAVETAAQYACIIYYASIVCSLAFQHLEIARRKEFH